MKTAIIKLPSDKDAKWVFSYGSSTTKRKSAQALFKLISRKIRGYAQKDTLVIRVKEHKVITNQSIPSRDLKYLKYVTTLFLEDFLSEKTLRKQEKIYLN